MRCRATKRFPITMPLHGAIGAGAIELSRHVREVPLPSPPHFFDSGVDRQGRVLPRSDSCRKFPSPNSAVSACWSTIADVVFLAYLNREFKCMFIFILGQNKARRNIF